jgi:restriction system protein
MARRQQPLFQTLFFVPWWVGVLLGIGGYAVANLLISRFFEHELLTHYAEMFRLFAMIWLVMCLVAATGSAIRSFFIHRKFDQQTSIEDIRKLSWQQFEIIVGEAFRRLGYRVIENGGGGADGGIDLILDREGQRFLVQCKQWKVQKVGVKPVRELAGVMSAHGVRDGFFVTSGTYTKEAREFADEADISLVDGDSLERMVRDIQRPASLNTQVQAVARPVACPECGGGMIKRHARRGANAGAAFWGCRGFPECRGMRGA